MKDITYKKIITIFLLLIIFIILNTGTTKAVLQSNGNTEAKYTPNDLILKIRQMEQLGGAMGLSESLNENLTSSTPSNNIDVHMEKNTEYGALAILSASSYGNSKKIEDGGTTTGNSTGVVMKLNYERVCAGTINNSTVPNFYKACQRYKNIYEESSLSAKCFKGDAMLETSGWHEAKNGTWFDYDGKYEVMVRSDLKSIFSYDCGNGGNYSLPAALYKTWSSRAVVVSGEGL